MQLRQGNTLHSAQPIVSTVPAVVSMHRLTEQLIHSCGTGWAAVRKTPDWKMTDLVAGLEKRQDRVFCVAP